MNKRFKSFALGAVLGLVALTVGRVQAANPAFLNIDVTISQALSVAVSSAASSTMTYQWDASANRIKVSATTTTVTNDSGGLTESWNLRTIAQSINTAGASVPWTLRASTNSADVGPEQFAVMAQFLVDGTPSCPVVADASWLANGRPNLLNTASQIYGAAFAGGNAYVGTGGAPDSGNLLYAGSRRALCWKVIGPTTTANTTGMQNIQIIITAQ